MVDLQGVRAHWDAQAVGFDDEPDHGLRDPATYAAWDSLLISVLGSELRQVVDLGAGTGTLSLLLARRGHAVVGLDISPAMATRAAEKALAEELSAGFGVADAADPPVAAGSVDVVLGRHVLWALPEIGAVLDRWLGLLRPGGRLVLIEGFWQADGDPSGCGGGLRAQQVLLALRGLGVTPQLRPLPQRRYWGREITDERYLITAPVPTSHGAH